MATIKGIYKVHKESYYWETITFWCTELRKWSQTYKIILKVEKIYMVDIPELWHCQYIKCFHDKTIRNIIVSTEDNSVTFLAVNPAIFSGYLTASHFSHFSYLQKMKNPFVLSACLCRHERMNEHLKEWRRKEGRGEEKSYLVHKYTHTYFYILMLFC